MGWTEFILWGLAIIFVGPIVAYALFYLLYLLFAGLAVAVFFGVVLVVDILCGRPGR